MSNDTNIIDIYNIEDAILDGETVLMSSMVTDDLLEDSKLFISMPIAFTKKVANLLKDKPDCEDINGRCWDIITCLRSAIVRQKEKPKSLSFVVNISTKEEPLAKEVMLYALVEVKRDMSPIILIDK